MEPRGRMMWLLVWAAVTALGSTGVRATQPDDMKMVTEIRATASRGLYVGNREPLEPSPLMKLPIGSIKPRGWLRYQLETEVKGMTGRLSEISDWCKFESNAWTDPQGKGHSGWEEMPYW